MEAAVATDKMLSKKESGVGWMIFNNPERHNAISLEMWAGVERILDGFATDPEIRVLIVTGAGGKAFVSGADISKFKNERATKEDVTHYNATTARGYAKLAQFPKPTIAMVRGYCIGGGVGMAVSCDMRICSEGSKFGIPAAKLGLGYGFVGVKRLTDLVGPSFAKEMFFTAKQFTAAQAQAMGLVNRVLPDTELEAFVMDYANTIAGNAPLTVDSVKYIINQTTRDPAERDLARCDQLVKECFASQDYIEGRTAFMEKRKPVFSGR
jgi:enoyl-CoA hydratase/carnithine racemase